MRIPKSVNLYVKSMGRYLRITAIFTNINKCNDYCKGCDDGIVAVIGKDEFILTSNIYGKGNK